MSDTLNRMKLKLRPINGSIKGNGNDKSPPSSLSKLLINHGKPNYTIQRSPKVQQNGGGSSPGKELQNSNRNNYYPYKSAAVMGIANVNINGNSNNNNSNNNHNNNIVVNHNNNSQNGPDLVIQSTKFNGVFKPANIPLPPNQAKSGDVTDGAPVVLRRVPKPDQPEQQRGTDENVPEFIRRQRRIQERLAKENILDFENRRSGYFTHVLISPTSPNRTSLVETMSSPPIMPGLEIPAPVKEMKEASVAEENGADLKLANGSLQAPQDSPSMMASNGHVEEEEVAKAIEEVNKAVAGEVDDDKADIAEVTAMQEKMWQNELHDGQIEEYHIEKNENRKVGESGAAVIHADVCAPLIELETLERMPPDLIKFETNPEHEPEISKLAKKATVAPAEVSQPTLDHVNNVKPPKDNGEQRDTGEQHKHNGYGEKETSATDGHAKDVVTILHANSVGNGQLPNAAPKAAVANSKDSAEPTKYADTEKLVKSKVNTPVTPVSNARKEMKLKFDIKVDEEDVQVITVLRGK